MTLHYSAVSNELISLLKELMSRPELSDFYLVGGTALALRCGHRKSIDLDFFTGQPFEADPIRGFLEDEYDAQEVTVATNTVLCFIQGIKIDFIAHRYPQIHKVDTVDEIRMASIADIVAMKLNAIANRGTKKDFWDYALLLESYEKAKLFELYTRKYPQASLWNLEKSLAFFDDAEHQPDPADLRGQTWDQVKRVISDSNRI